MKKLLLVLMLIPLVSFGQETTIVVDEFGNKIGTYEADNTTNRKGGIKSNVDVFEASKNAYSNQNILGGVSDDTYDELGDAVGQLAAKILIKKKQKKNTLNISKNIRKTRL